MTKLLVVGQLEVDCGVALMPIRSAGDLPGTLAASWSEAGGGITQA
jgi:hypothetical protein